MKKLGITMLLVGIAFLSGCTSYKEMDSPSLKMFQEQVGKTVPGVTSLETVTHPTRLLFRYTFGTEPDITVQQDIVKRTDGYICTETFETEVLASYYASYNKKDRIPPDIVLSMDTDGDGEANFEYYASFGKEGGWSWWYSDYKSMHTEVILP
ncbi:hypothetical protein EBB07_05170 [Paenibacillaceae bacterium]|nr:hypothetical protein EBB07_05170 [Paenibacillaceae bacterium]